MLGDPKDGRSLMLASAGLPFVIIGPTSPHRKVLIRSPNATLDLIGLDGLGEFHRDRQSIVSEVFFLLPGMGSSMIGRNIVDSEPTITASPYDDRRSNLSFAWRGLANGREIEEVRHMFKIRTVDIYEAYRRNDVDELEVLLSPIILKCEIYDERRRRQKRAMNYATALVFVSYAVVGVGFLLRDLLR